VRKAVDDIHHNARAVHRLFSGRVILEQPTAAMKTTMRENQSTDQEHKTSRCDQTYAIN
jgi:hypothetical protein